MSVSASMNARPLLYLLPAAGGSGPVAGGSGPVAGGSGPVAGGSGLTTCACGGLTDCGCGCGCGLIGVDHSGMASTSASQQG
jgi:hypothetical protein